MSTSPDKLTIFYSWQSDLPDNTNRNAIRCGLRSAINLVEKEFAESSLVVELDEATRSTSGSPNIPLTILEKIRVADIFVCDVTTINKETNDARKTPNPNVVYELGYAVAQLGWGRIIMLFNTFYGNLSKDLPFDFDRHRVSTYELGVDATSKAEKNLASLLKRAIETVVKTDPERPSHRMSTEEIKRFRDTKNIIKALSVIHLPTLDQHLKDVPGMVLDKVLDFWYSFDYIINSSSFYLYDTKLDCAIRKLYRYWGETVTNGESYHPNFDASVYHFSNPEYTLFSKLHKSKWNAVGEAARKARLALDEVLKIVRENYIDVSVDETNRAAWDEYVDFYRKQTTQKESVENDANNRLQVKPIR